MAFLERRPYENDTNETFSCGKGLRTFIKMFKELFQPRSRTEKDKMFVKVLQYRAWVIHAGLTLIRLFNWVLGDS